MTCGFAFLVGRAGTVADWTFEEGTPGTLAGQVQDHSGRGHHSVRIFGAPRFVVTATNRVDPLPGVSLYLPPGNPWAYGSGFLVADHPDLDLTDAFTLEAQVMPEPDGNGSWRAIINRDAGANRPGMIAYALSFDDLTHDVAFGITGASGASFSVRASFPSMDGASHHVAGVCSNLVLRLYIDGYLVASGTASEPPARGVLAGVAIGANTVGGYWYRGTLDRVRISDEALLPGQFFNLQARAAWQAWAAGHFGPNYATRPEAQLEADPDADGASNAEEFVRGTDPLDPLSGFKTGVRLVPLIAWPSVAGKDYQVQRKASLTATNWTVVVERFQATNTMSSVVDTLAPPFALYRVSLLP